jgi:hypothetical protein
MNAIIVYDTVTYRNSLKLESESMNSLSTGPTLAFPPGRFGLPIIGESIQYLRDPEGFIVQRQQQYGNVFKTHLFGRPTIALIGADARANASKF